MKKEFIVDVGLYNSYCPDCVCMVLLFAEPKECESWQQFV